MPYTDSGLELQEPGTNENTWGDVLNEVLELIDELARGRAAYTLSGLKTLTSGDGVSNEARCPVQHITGGTGGTVTTPSISKGYMVINQASGDVIFTTGATAVTIAAGETALVVCDGTNFRKVQATDFGGSRLTSLANPVDDQDAATKAWVMAQVFSTVLPDGGDAGEVIRWNGTDWASAQLGVEDVEGAAPADAAVLTGGMSLTGDASITGDATITGAGEVEGRLTASGGLDVIEGVRIRKEALSGTVIDFAGKNVLTKSISANTAFTVDGLDAGDLQIAYLILTITASAEPSFPPEFGFEDGLDFLGDLGDGTHWLTIASHDGGASGVIGLLYRNVST